MKLKDLFESGVLLRLTADNSTRIDDEGSSDGEMNVHREYDVVETDTKRVVGQAVYTRGPLADGRVKGTVYAEPFSLGLIVKDPQAAINHFIKKMGIGQ